MLKKSGRRSAPAQMYLSHIGTPLLQFWHHEVADPRAKTQQKFKSQTQNLKGFQRDWWIPGPSIFYCFLNEFQHFAKNGHQGSMKDSSRPISENSRWHLVALIACHQLEPGSEGVFGTFGTSAARRRHRLAVALHVMSPASPLRSKSGSKS